MEQIEIFKPSLAELQSLADRLRGLTIAGVADEAGYKKVKEARKELGDMRNFITKFGKSKRDEAIAFQKEVIRQENQHLDLITPLENEYKALLASIDEEKLREARRANLPTRRAMLDEIGMEMEENAILALDDDQFYNFFSQQKMKFLEAREEERKKEKEEERRKLEIEHEKELAAENAILAERARVEAENLRIANEAIAKSKAMQEEQKRTEKNKAYREWLEMNQVTSHSLSTGDAKVERNGNTFKLYRLVDEITIG